MSIDFVITYVRYISVQKIIKCDIFSPLSSILLDRLMKYRATIKTHQILIYETREQPLCRLPYYNN
ncbi:hypothetical protein SAMN04488129_12635 [Halomonas daqiaonensis]|uniref:Uncharacterized protein n=1 Tax=Halomonas daqiaonensis TaxID=650850 RepID=A0A1H7VQM4_9GAMM|nr:hypothetical protein SAMN04488129_12635 [Halomonas daqiaonensis]